MSEYENLKEICNSWEQDAKKLINIRKDSQYRDELLHILTVFNDARESMYELLSEVDSEN
jgi:hypothetical protein